MDPWYGSGVGVTAGIVSGVGYFFYCKSSQNLRLLQDAPIYDQEFENLKSKVQTVGTLPYAAVNGKVIADNDVLVASNSSSVTGVVHRRTINELKTVWSSNLNQWNDQKEMISSSCQTKPFSIASNVDQNLRIHVTEPLESDILQLSTISNEYSPVTTSTAETILTFASGERIKGIETVEEMLTVNTNITAVGQISLSNDGSLVMKPPSIPSASYILTQDSMEHIIASQKSSLRLLKHFIAITAAISGAFLSYWIYKHYIKKYLEKRRFDKLSAEISNGSVNISELDYNSTCLICADRPRDVVILGCGHVCSCKQCTDLLETCPVCRATIDRCVPIYHS